MDVELRLADALERRVGRVLSPERSRLLPAQQPLVRGGGAGHPARVAVRTVDDDSRVLAAAGIGLRRGGDDGQLRPVVLVAREVPSDDEQLVALLQRDVAVEQHGAEVAARRLEQRGRRLQRDRRVGRPREGRRRRLPRLDGDSRRRAVRHLEACGDDDGLVRPGRPAQRGDPADRGDRRPRLIAQQRHETGHARGQLRGAQVALVGDPLVVEGEDVGEVGPPFEDLEAEVAGRRDASRAAPARPAAVASSARRKPLKSSTRSAIVDSPGGLVTTCGSWPPSHGHGAGAHLPPSTSTRNEPSSGRLGSSSTRRMRSAGIETVSGSGAQPGCTPRSR